MTASNVALVLTAHMPYLRTPGRDPVGEDALHELIALAIVPTISTLFDMYEQGHELPVALAYSPILLEQLADLVVQKHFSFWMDGWQERLNKAIAKAEAAGQAQRLYTARFFAEWAAGVRHSFEDRFHRNLPAVLRQLYETGLVEPIASTASFVKLTSIHQPGTLRAQIELGAMAVTRVFGAQPQGFWPPSLAYRADAGAQLHASGLRYLVVAPAERQPGTAKRASIPLHSFARDHTLDDHLYTPELAYAGDPLYLATQPESAPTLWERVSGASARLYDPYDAYKRAQEHAEHFAGVLAAGQGSGLRLVAFDAGLVGQRWFEGAAWLRSLLETLAAHQPKLLTTPSTYMQHLQKPVESHALLTPPSGETPLFSLQQSLHNAERRIAALSEQASDASGIGERTLQQAARELLLAQSNDIAPGNAFDPPRRALRHLARCIQLCDLAERAELSEDDLTLLETLEEEDNAFAYLNYRVFHA